MKHTLKIALLFATILLFVFGGCQRQTIDGSIITSTTTSECTHVKVIDPAIAATCTDVGFTQGSHCKLCNKIFEEQKALPALGHTEVIIEEKAPTCTEAGSTQGIECSVCKDVLILPTITAPLGHTPITDVQIDPTCTQNGLSEGSHCSVCNDVLVVQVPIEAHGHHVETRVGQAPTCTKDGFSDSTFCKICNETLSNSVVIKATGHKETTIKAVAATCAKTGLTEGKRCSVCNIVTVSQKSVEKTPHIYKNQYKCDCGDYFEDAKIVILSQNVRCANDGNNKNISDRAPRFKQLVEKYSPDLIGTQETTATWNNYFKTYFSSKYGMVGCSRDGKNAQTGEWGTILYRLDRFQLIDSGDFWLSSTPNKVSRVSGSNCNRICTWALLKDKVTGKTFVFANTHLDHGTDAVRDQQIKYLFSGLSDYINKYPIYITGDFNATPDSNVYAITANKLLDARTTALEDRSTVQYTFDSYGTKFPGKVIDYCFYSNHSEALFYQVLNDKFGGFVSDHYGVLSQFIIK